MAAAHDPERSTCCHETSIHVWELASPQVHLGLTGRLIDAEIQTPRMLNGAVAVPLDAEEILRGDVPVATNRDSLLDERVHFLMRQGGQCRFLVVSQDDHWHCR